MAILSIALLMTSCQSIQKTERSANHLIALVIKPSQGTEHLKIKEKERAVEKEAVIIEEEETAKTYAVIEEAEVKDEVIEDNEQYDENISTASLNKENRITERTDNYKTVTNKSALIKENEDKYKVAPQLVYSIQTGSYNKISHAQKEFDSIIQDLKGKEIEYLRMEKIGKYFTIRLGKFDDYVVAEEYFMTNQPQLSESIILKALMKNERNIKTFGYIE